MAPHDQHDSSAAYLASLIKCGGRKRLPAVMELVNNGLLLCLHKQKLTGQSGFFAEGTTDVLFELSRRVGL